MTFSIGMLSLADPSKKRCGDNCGNALGNSNVVVACVADGVGGLAQDWKASMLAVDVFLDTMRRGSGPASNECMLCALEAANRAVLDACTDEPRMASTFVAVTWDSSTGLIYWTSIGDSRLYQVDTYGTMRLLSCDQTQAMLLRDSSGKLVASSGAVAVRAGLTAAIGDYNLDPKVETLVGTDTVALLLVTDGMYNNQAFSKDMIDDVLAGKPLQKALDPYAGLLRDGQFDDATLVIMRNNDVPESVEKRIIGLFDSGVGFTSTGFSSFHVAQTIERLLESAMNAGDRDRLVKLLATVGSSGIRLGLDVFRMLLDFECSGRQDREVINRLVGLAQIAKV